MRVNLGKEEVKSGQDLLFEVAKRKRGGIMPKIKKNLGKLMHKKAHSDSNCDPGHAFLAVDGSTFSSIMDLTDALEMMSDDTFYYHVNDFKNDFANWVKDVFHMDELADQIQRARTKERTEIVLLRHILKSG
jgi:hypothetical protein